MITSYNIRLQMSDLDGLFGSDSEPEAKPESILVNVRFNSIDYV